MTGEDDLPLSASMDAPPPSPDLLARLAGLRPVRPRSPRWSWLVALLGAAAIAASGLTLFRFRPDLAHLPRAWVVGAGLLWLAAAALPLWVTLVPPRGQVLPDARRALFVALAALALVLAFSFLYAADAPGHSRPVGDRFWPLALHCAAVVVAVFAAAFTIVLLAMRRLFPVGAARAGVAGGVAAGALGGLLLHVICPYAEATHVGVGHAGTVAVCAALGAAIARLVAK